MVLFNFKKNFDGILSSVISFINLLEIKLKIGVKIKEIIQYPTNIPKHVNTQSPISSLYIWRS